jgi:outer membrane protein assembly factor BamD (BamD/ComL family)
MKKYFALFVVATLSLSALEEEELTWDENAPSAVEYNSSLQEALANKDWWGAIDFANIIAYNFPSSPFSYELPYLMGFAYCQVEQYELANKSLSAYLNHSASHSHFEEAVRMKFEIAQAFLHGKKKRLFGCHKLPAWLSAKEDALEIFDEVIATVPHSDMAAASLLGKAKIQTEFEDYKPAVETLAMLIRRFPKTDAAAEAYLEIAHVYFQQSQNSSLDLDILELAEVNLRKFKSAFPREARVLEAEKILSETDELFAANLLDTGQFFERTKKTSASIIYYNRVVAKYPDTKAAEAARKKLQVLQPVVMPIVIQEEPKEAGFDDEEVVQ